MKPITKILTFVAVVVLSAAAYAASESITDTLVLPGSASGALKVEAASAVTDYTLVFPATAGTSTYVLTTDGAGATSWTAPGLSSALTADFIYVGSAGGAATGVPQSGDGSFSQAGAFAIASDVIINTDVKSDAAIAFSKMAGLTASSGLVTNLSGVIVPAAGVSAAEVGYLGDVTSAIQAQLDGKLTDTLASANLFVGNGSAAATAVPMSGDIVIDNTGATSFNGAVIVNADVNASAAIAYSKMENLSNSLAMVTDGSGDPTTVANVTATEVGYLNDVTSDIQAQIDGISAASGSWTKVTKGFAAFSTEQIEAFSLADKEVVEAIMLDVTAFGTTGCTGGSTVSIGTVAKPEKYASEFDAEATANRITSSLGFETLTGGPTSIKITADCVTSGTFAPTSGSVDIYYKVSTLP